MPTKDLNLFVGSFHNVPEECNKQTSISPQYKRLKGNMAEQDFLLIKFLDSREQSIQTEPPQRISITNV